MKLAILGFIVTILAGCSGVILSAAYRTKLDDTGAIVHVTATRAAAGQATTQEMARSIGQADKTINEIRNAADGKVSP